MWSAAQSLPTSDVGRADISGSADLDRVENRGVGDPCGERRLRRLCSLGAGDLDGDGYVLRWWTGTVKWREVGARGRASRIDRLLHLSQVAPQAPTVGDLHRPGVRPTGPPRRGHRPDPGPCEILGPSVLHIVLPANVFVVRQRVAPPAAQVSRPPRGPHISWWPMMRGLDNAEGARTEIRAPFGDVAISPRRSPSCASDASASPRPRQPPRRRARQSSGGDGRVATVFVRLENGGRDTTACRHLQTVGVGPLTDRRSLLTRPTARADVRADIRGRDATAEPPARRALLTNGAKASRSAAACFSLRSIS